MDTRSMNQTNKPNQKRLYWQPSTHQLTCFAIPVGVLAFRETKRSQWKWVKILSIHAYVNAPKLGFKTLLIRKNPANRWPKILASTGLRDRPNKPNSIKNNPITVRIAIQPSPWKHCKQGLQRSLIYPDFIFLSREKSGLKNPITLGKQTPYVFAKKC